MRKARLKPFLLILLLITATAAAMAYTAAREKPFTTGITNSGPNASSKTGIVSISGHLVQSKILQGSPGIVNLSLSIQADGALATASDEHRNVDMVIVLDRSGSMKGRKIEDAKQAISKLLASLSINDRIALVTYSEGIQKLSGLIAVNEPNRLYLESVVSGVRAGGGTNLGAGLKAGIKVLLAATQNGNAGKVILISDGLANKGVTHPQHLGNMAAIAIAKEFSISTVGVGLEFNEYLMTTIADRGAGNYYYLENPESFAETFEKEFYYAKATVANGICVRIPLKSGVELVDASGYPIEIQNNQAIFYPGDLRSGQTRKLFLSLRIPTVNERKFEIDNISVAYMHKDQYYQATIKEAFEIACVRNKAEVYSSIDKAAWTEKVLQEDFNRLKQEVAKDVKAGNKSGALGRIQMYLDEQETVNANVHSPAVSENLNNDLNKLREVVEDTFQGKPAEISRKQKANSKLLQFNGYRGRRQQK
jgi:Ca-activated chloride channel family protein